MLYSLDELFRAIGSDILGECMNEAHVIEKFGLEIDEEDFVEKMLDLSIEYCSFCGRWKESSDMAEDTQEVICYDCHTQ